MELAVTCSDMIHLTDTMTYPLNIMDSLGFGVVVVHASSRKITYVNHAAAQIIGQDKSRIVGSICHQYICPAEVGRCPIADLGQVVDNSERLLLKATGERIPIIKTVVVAESDGEHYLIESFVDISERRKAEDLLNVDSLTGLHNRTFFERELIRLGGKTDPVGIVVCDIDGLKLINDTLGHEKGNELLKLTSSILRKACREGDCTARIGGDEFVLLLPNRSRQELDAACRLIQKTITTYNADHSSMLLSMSLGSCWQQNGQYIHDALQEADNSMYRHKLHNGQSARSAILQALMIALEARDFATQGHTERVGELSLKLACHLDLTEQCVTDIWLLSKFHDIGKVGIPDQVLFKDGPLTKTERAVINRHSEIGYRIARSASDISHVSDFILKHHEWWNGKGYPLGLKGEEIPIECRIVAIADAFDAMTNDRPYRKAMSDAEASRQLELFAGKQFDPRIVKIFLEKVLNDQQT